MNRYIAILFTLLAILLLSETKGLNRDYYPDCGDSSPHQYYCLYDIPSDFAEKNSIDFLEFIPATGPKCVECYDPSIYLGYLDNDYRKYFAHLEHQLKYSSQHHDCLCLWPEYSSEAAQISDTAYLLVQDLILTTALSNLLENKDEQKKFIESSYFFNRHGLTISFIAQQFRFSDYFHVCLDIGNYAVANYKDREAAKIKDKLDDILEALYPKFFALYNSCYTKHPNADIDQEIRFMKLLVGDISGLSKTINSNVSVCQFNQQLDDTSEFIIRNLRTLGNQLS